MKRQRVIAWLSISCGILLCAIGPFAEPHAQAQNATSQNSQGAATAPVSREASGNHAAQEPKSASQRAAGQKLAEEQFKNIQVLKGVPAEQIFPTMQFISASLGVECEFCHVQNAFEKDDKKPKQTARKMIDMMFLAHVFAGLVQSPIEPAL